MNDPLTNWALDQIEKNLDAGRLMDPWANDYRYLGNFSAVDPAYSRGMSCHACRVEWTGCWDNFQCPICGEGELPGFPSEPPPAPPTKGDGPARPSLG